MSEGYRIWMSSIASSARSTQNNQVIYVAHLRHNAFLLHFTGSSILNLEIS